MIIKPGTRTRPSRFVAGAALAALVGAALAPQAAALPSDDSEAAAQLIAVDALGLGALDALEQTSGYPSDPGPSFGEIDATVLEGLADVEIDLGGGATVPLIGDGDDDGLLDLGPTADAGALGSYAASPDATSSTAATGAVGSDGTIDLGPFADPGSVDNATLDLTALLGQLDVDGLSDDVVDEVSLGLGAVAARAEATGVGTYDSEYVLAGAELRISSPAAGEVAGDIAAAYDPLIDAVETAVDDAVGTGGVVDDALGLADLPDVTIPDVATVALDRPTATVTVDLPDLDAALLEQAVSDDGVVTIDLTTGLVTVDLAQLVNGPGATDLNGLPANTSVLTDDTIEAVVAGVGEALGNLVDSITTEVVAALEDAELVISVSGDVELLDGTASAPLAFTVTGSLADFAGTSGTAPVVSTVADITLTPPDPEPPVTITAETLGLLVVAPAVAAVTGTTGPVVATLLETRSAEIEGGLTDVVDVTLEPLEPVLDGVLSQIVSLTVNEQPTEAPIDGEGDLGGDSFTVRALAIDLLPGVLGVGVDLASASVRASDLPAALTATPDPVQQGGDVTATGTNFAPGADVTVTYVDADGVTVTTSTVTTDGSGDFTDTVTLPADITLGVLTVTADDGTDELSDAVQVVGVADEPGVTVAPDPVQQGGTVDVVGVGFAPDAPVTVTYTDADGGVIGTSTVTTDGAGGFTDSLVVPDDTPLGGLTVEATDGDGTAADTVQVVAVADEPGVTAAPDPVQQGGTVDVVGVGFAPDALVTVTYTDADGAVIGTSSVTTDGAGGFTDSLVVPDDTPLGGLTVEASDGDGAAADTVQVVAVADEPAVTAAPDPVQQGGTLGVVGVGFTPNSQVTVTYTDADGAVIGTSTVTTDGAGGFTDSLVVPDDTPLGELVVTADDGIGAAGDSVQVIAVADEPAVTAAPDPVQQGGTLEVVGVGFTPNSQVTVTYTDADGAVIGTSTVTTDGAGGFADSLVVPQGTPPGDLTVEATDGDGTAADTVQVVAAVDEPTIVVSPDPVEIGEEITVVGAGFPPSTEVTVVVTDADGDVVGETTVVTDGNGGFVATFVVPEGTALGPLQVTATGDGVTAAAAVQVIDPDAISIAIEHETRYRQQVQTGYGYGYAPGTVVHGYMNSTPSLDLGTQVADEDGTVTFVWTIPANAAIDTHTFSLEADGYPDQSIEFRVLATPAGGLPDTGSDVAMAGFAASGLFLVGLLLLAATRTAVRRRSAVG